MSARDDALLDALLRDTRARQSMIRSAMEDEDEAEPLPFVGKHEVTDRHDDVLGSLRDLLGVDLYEYRAKRTAEEGFNFLRSRAERAGVFVLIRSDLGSYHTTLETSVFRGIAISDALAPFVVINSRDARAAWTFTLLHELVHILLGQTSVGNSNTENSNERFCDDVAATYLLQPSELQEAMIFDGGEFTATVEKINTFAGERNVSRAMVTYNAYRANLIDVSEYRDFSRFFREQWEAQREREGLRLRDTDFRIDPYVIRRHRIGRSMLTFAKRMTEAGVFSTTKAAKVLGVRPNQVQRMLEKTA